MRASSRRVALSVIVTLLLLALWERGAIGNQRVQASGGCLPKPEWVLATARVGDQPVRVGVNAADGRAYVLSRARGTVTVIDTHSLEIIATWDVGADPVALAVSSKLSTVYVARRQEAASELLMLDGQTGSIRQSRPLGFVVADIAIHPAGGSVAMVGWDGGKVGGDASSNGAVMSVDDASGQTTAFRLLGGRFHQYLSVAISPVDSRIYTIWNQRYGRTGVDAFDGTTLDRIGGLSPSGDHGFTSLAIDGPGKRLMLGTTWQWIDTVDIDLPLRRPLDYTEGDLLLGRVDVERPSHMVYDDETRMLYVTRWPLGDERQSSSDLIVVDTGSYAVLGSVHIGAGSHHISLDSGSRRIFVTNSADGSVTVVQGVLPGSSC